MTAPLAIGVDIGGTHLRIGLVDRDGGVSGLRRTPTPANDPRSLTEILAEQIAAFEEDLPVGIGIAGLVTPDGTVRYGPNIGLRDLPLATALRSELDRSIAVLNDASAAALGEQRFGAGQGFDDLVLFTIGTGVGGGIVLAGRLVLGTSGFAGELGHLVVAEGGRACPCGNAGCIEAYAAGTAIGRIATERLAEHGRPSALRDRPQIDGPAVTAAAAEGDPVAREVLVEVGGWLGVAIANCVNALDPGLVLIGGGAAVPIAPFVLPSARAAAGARLLGHAYRQAPPIEVATRGDEAGLLGAAWYAAGRAAGRGGRT